MQNTQFLYFLCTTLFFEIDDDVERDNINTGAAGYIGYYNSDDNSSDEILDSSPSNASNTEVPDHNVANAERQANFNPAILAFNGK